MQFGILDLLQVTVFVSVFALLLAMPVALGIAIFLTQYAPRRVSGPLAYMVDLLAAVPSIIYGVWGLYVLGPGDQAVRDVAEREPQLALLVPDRQRLGGRRRNDLHRGDRAGGDDPADHHRGHPRGVRPDAARTDRGGAGAGRHPLGGREDHGAAVRVVRLHQRRDARPRPRARRDDRPADHPARHAAGVRVVAVRRAATRSRARSPLPLRNSTTSTRRARTSRPAWCCSS